MKKKEFYVPMKEKEFYEVIMKEKEKASPFEKLLYLCFVILFFSIIYGRSYCQANYYENLASKDIECISFLTDSEKPKDRILLLKICDPKDIKYFLSNYWGEMEEAVTYRAWGSSFQVSIKKTNGVINVFSVNVALDGFAKLYTSEPIKSYKLYNLLKLLEEKNRQLEVKRKLK